MYFGTFVDQCMKAIGDSLGSHWPRTLVFEFAKDAIRAFPIPRPMQTTLTAAAGEHLYDLPLDFRQVVSVQYPAGQQPPASLSRLSHENPAFWQSDSLYDIDRNYADSAGHQVWLSASPADGQEILVCYLADHDAEMSEYATISVPDRYLHLLILYVIWRAWLERLGAEQKDPTAHTTLLNELAHAASQAEAAYQAAVGRALAETAESRRTPALRMDGFDRIY